MGWFGPVPGLMGQGDLQIHTLGKGKDEKRKQERDGTKNKTVAMILGNTN